MLQSKLPMSKHKRYCCIQSCINFKGSVMGEYTFFRAPPDQCTYDKWIEAIGEHQKIRHISLICELHFKPQDVVSFGYSNRRKLKSGSIPCIFVPNHNAIKTEPTNTSEPGALADEKILNKISIKQQFNKNDSMACQNCIDQKFEIQELNQKLEIQTSLAEYWKAIALKYEPDHKDPNRSFDHAEKVTTELLEIPPPPPLPDKVFKPYQCGTCNECFEKPRQLDQHIQEHSRKKYQSIESFQKCIVCSEYLDKDEIDRHLCMRQKQIACEHCEKSFSSTSRLLKHLNAAHKNIILYKCMRCQQSFGMNLLMTIHNESHDKEDIDTQNRFKCKACSIAFAFSSNLEKHQKLHCPFIKKANSQLCELCGKNFQHIDELKQHMQQHNEFECRICVKFFKTTFSLKKHYERHHGSSAATINNETQMDIS